MNSRPCFPTFFLLVAFLIVYYVGLFITQLLLTRAGTATIPASTGGERTSTVTLQTPLNSTSQPPISSASSAAEATKHFSALAPVTSSARYKFAYSTGSIGLSSTVSDINSKKTAESHTAIASSTPSITSTIIFPTATEPTENFSASPKTGLIFQEFTTGHTNTTVKNTSTQMTSTTTFPTADDNQQTSTLSKYPGKNGSNGCPNGDDYSPCNCSINQQGYKLSCNNLSISQINAIFNRTNPAIFFLLDLKFIALNASAGDDKFTNLKQASHFRLHCKNQHYLAKRGEKAFLPSSACSTSLSIEFCQLPWKTFSDFFELKQLTNYSSTAAATSSSTVTSPGLQCLKLKDNGMTTQQLDDFLKKIQPLSQETLRSVSIRNGLEAIPQQISFFKSLKQLKLVNTDGDGEALRVNQLMGLVAPIDEFIVVSNNVEWSVSGDVLKKNFNNISLTILDQQVYIEETPFKAFFEGGGRLNLTQSRINCAPFRMKWLCRRPDLFQWVSEGFCDGSENVTHSSIVSYCDRWKTRIGTLQGLDHG